MLKNNLDEDFPTGQEPLPNIEISRPELSHLEPLVATAWESLEKRMQTYQNASVRDSVFQAFLFAHKLHQGQVRKSGEPYIIHPVAVAEILTSLHMDETSLVAALLHDVVEDTQVSVKQVEEKFGANVSAIVDGLTKLAKVEFRSTQEKLAENFRKMVLAMSKDIRVIIVKVADRTHNMRTLKALPIEKRQRIADETLEIYAPLAGRLGIYKLKAELEDLCLKELKPSVYFSLVSRVAQKKDERENIIKNAREHLQERLATNNISATVVGRAKHFYSIYKKMSERQMDFEDIYDLFAVRVLVDTVGECYEALGTIHNEYRPVPGRFKDYIAMPKANLYQSLHTTVVAARGELLEIQIRTWEMHEICENGIAAHWAYKETRKDGGRMQKLADDIEKFSWLQQMVRHQNELTDPNEFLEAVKVDLFEDEVYVFSPKGDVFELPRGSTCLDFAFAIHSDVGLRTTGAKVNGRIMPLRSVLDSGDVVEIMAGARIRATKDWLSIVSTNRAKGKIRQWLRSEDRDDARKSGEALLDTALQKHGTNYEKLLKLGALQDVNKIFSVSSAEDLILQIGYGKLEPSLVAARLLGVPQPEPALPLSQPTQTLSPTNARSLPDSSSSFHTSSSTQQPKKVSNKNTKRAEEGVRVQGLEGISVRLAKCCQPLPGQPIVGFVSRGHGVTVHSASCEWSLTNDPARRVECNWNTSEALDLSVRLRILTHDKPGVLANVTKLVANSGLNILGAEVQTTPDKRGVITLRLRVGNIAELRDIHQKLEATDGVICVDRLTG
jgi:GTP pyrophosphokinase